MSKKTSIDHWILPIRAIPNASRNEIVGWEQGVLKIKLRAVPEDGKANKELFRYFAKCLKIQKSSFELEQGEKSRHKRVKVSGLTVQEFFAKLEMDLPEEFGK